MPVIEPEWIAVGGNRHSSAADWSQGNLAFGAGNGVALWNPNDPKGHGIRYILSGHTDSVNAVKILQRSDEHVIISGSADKTVRIWAPAQNISGYEERQRISEHTHAVNAIAVLPESDFFVTGAADGTIKVWEFDNTTAVLAQSITLKPRYLPLALSIAVLPGGEIILAVAGTSNSIQIFCRPTSSSEFGLQATLTGHEGWIRSLDFTNEHDTKNSDILLASASQDKYIRIWRFRRSHRESDDSRAGVGAGAPNALSNKVREVGNVTNPYAVTFEALLIGHEDWVYSLRWSPSQRSDHKVSLLSASADNSLAIWNVDNEAGVWVCTTRLGEISSQKGSTTATGSTGGFWQGLWQPDGLSVVSLGRTGSWRRWVFDAKADMWLPTLGITGHTREVQSLTWAPTGNYLLSTASDQTTRLFAQWHQEGNATWHEFARPQIHGYDLNCIDSITENRFISGADEKLLRVFDMPKAIDNLLCKLSDSQGSSTDLPDAANIPVLGLSNKAVAAIDDESLVLEDASGQVNGGEDREALDPASVVRKSTLDLDHPPLEDHLARHTLWPEHEKLYGHGYEISAVATSHDRSLVATACKASSVDHAVVRLYETYEWREIKPSLACHNLTVTSLEFSPGDKHLLSVGRDRQWAVYFRSNQDLNTYTLLTSNPKGHSRMILNSCWMPISSEDVFVTAGRDKQVKIWKLADRSFECLASVAAASAVTAIAANRSESADHVQLVYGTEDGKLVMLELDRECSSVLEQVEFDPKICPSQAITSIRWRPFSEKSNTSSIRYLAVSSEDQTVRLYNIR